MAYQRKQYRNGKPRGGQQGRAADTSFGAPDNLNKTKKAYKRRDPDTTPPPAGAHLLKRTTS